jgi:hypothetical protein
VIGSSGVLLFANTYSVLHAILRCFPVFFVITDMYPLLLFSLCLYNLCYMRNIGVLAVLAWDLTWGIGSSDVILVANTYSDLATSNFRCCSVFFVK